jgi:glyoxylase I family protein
MVLQGLHHVALFCADLDETVRFWTSVLKARLVRTGRDSDGDPGARHYYFDVGGEMVAFFEFPGQERESLQFGWMHHLAFRADSEPELEEWQRHIRSFDVHVSEIRTHDFVKSIYLHDPNGILIEIAWQHRPLTEADFSKDAQPVMAVREMLEP